MPGYVAKAIHRFTHTPDVRPQHSPHAWTPPNYGATYAKEFRDMFASVAKAEKTALVPFFLKGVADGPDPLALFQSDRIHPNEQAQPIMRDTVWPELRKLVAAR